MIAVANAGRAYLEERIVNLLLLGRHNQPVDQQLVVALELRTAHGQHGVR